MCASDKRTPHERVVIIGFRGERAREKGVQLVAGLEVGTPRVITMHCPNSLDSSSSLSHM